MGSCAGILLFRARPSFCRGNIVLEQRLPAQQIRTGAWLDEGVEVWGHEYLDRNRSTSTGISVLSGTHRQARERSA